MYSIFIPARLRASARVAMSVRSADDVPPNQRVSGRPSAAYSQYSRSRTSLRAAVAERSPEAGSHAMPWLPIVIA